MSKARLVITAVILEGRTQADAAATYGVSKGWVSKLIARYRAEGEAAFEPRSRRPRTSPAALEEPVVRLVLGLRERLAGAGLDAGPETSMCWRSGMMTVALGCARLSSRSLLYHPARRQPTWTSHGHTASGAAAMLTARVDSYWAFSTRPSPGSGAPTFG